MSAAIPTTCVECLLPTPHSLTARRFKRDGRMCRRCYTRLLKRDLAGLEPNKFRPNTIGPRPHTRHARPACWGSKRRAA